MSSRGNKKKKINLSKKHPEDLTRKMLRWLNTLNNEQVELIKRYCNENSKKDLQVFMYCLENVLRPYVYENSNNFIEGENKLSQIFDLLMEEAKKARELIEIGELYMNITESQKESIYERYIVNKENGINEKENYEDLSIQFPKITKTTIKSIVVYKKQEQQRKEEAEEFGKQLKKEFCDDIKENKSKDNKQVNEEPEEERSKEVQETKSKFKILKKVVDIAGEFNTYHVEEDKITVGGKTFSNEREIRDYYKEERDILVEQLKKLELRQNETIEALKFGVN